MKFRGFYNPRVARFLLDVPLEDLRTKLSNTVEESGGSDIELKPLKELLLREIPFLRLQLAPDTKYTVLDNNDAHGIVQELVSQHYLTFSEQKHARGLYFRIVDRDEVICACQR